MTKSRSLNGAKTICLKALLHSIGYNTECYNVRVMEKRKPKQYRSSLMASIHETAEGLHSAGVMDKRTLREFDELCLTPVQPLAPDQIRALRLREGASQAVFARYLNVTTGLVSQWERGERRPQGASLKLLSLVAQKGLSTVA
jgi:putative transcriptional regulator